MISRRQLTLAAAASAKRANRPRASAGHAEKRRGDFNQNKGWVWLLYALAAFALSLGLFYCAVRVLETAAQVVA